MKFSIKDLGTLKYFLGIEVGKVPEGLVLSQRNFIVDILKDSGMLGSRSKSFPREQDLKVDKDESKPKVDANQYHRLIVRLLYLQATRLDLAYPINILSQFVTNPFQPHLDALYRILCYLKATPGQGIILPCSGGTNVVAYSDYDWLGCPMTRRSRTSYLLFGGALISWKTKKQSVVSRSSVEAGYQAMATTSNEIIWMLWLLKKLGIEKSVSTILFCDNQATRHIANNPVFSRKN